jgi:hypothetical protein
MKNLENEIWKDIVGYEGKYQVSNLGRIKSLEYVIKKSNGKNHTQKEKIRKLSLGKKGYLFFNLGKKNGKQNIMTVHRAVAISFIENKNNLLCVDHIDEKKLNNKVENLRWASLSDNAKYWFSKRSFRGEKNNGSVLTEKDVVHILGEYYKGVEPKKIANGYRVGISTVMDIFKNRTWKHVPR